MKDKKPSKDNRVRAVVFLPPATHKALRRAADKDSLKMSQKAAQIIIEAMKSANP